VSGLLHGNSGKKPNRKISDKTRKLVIGAYVPFMGTDLLDEFCFHLNRRRWPGQIFNRVLNACMLASPVTYRDIVEPVPVG
jgi:hypothetical protein